MTPSTFGGYFESDSNSADYGNPKSTVAHGDTLEFEPGTYTTPIRLFGWEDLTLRGIEDSNGNRATFAVDRDRFLLRDIGTKYYTGGVQQSDSKNIVVHNLSFDLSRAAANGANDGFNTGVLYLSSSGTIPANYLSGFGNLGVSDFSIMAWARYAAGVGPTTRTQVTIIENTIADVGRSSILAVYWVQAIVIGNIVEETSDSFGFGVDFHTIRKCSTR